MSKKTYTGVKLYKSPLEELKKMPTKFKTGDLFYLPSEFPGARNVESKVAQPC
jgi:hypothetical protein